MSEFATFTSILCFRKLSKHYTNSVLAEMDHYQQQQHGHGGYDQNHGGHEEYVIGTTATNGEEPAYYQQFNHMSAPAQAEEMMRNSYNVHTPVQGRRHSSKDEIANEAAHAMLHLDGTNNQGKDKACIFFFATF